MGIGNSRKNNPKRRRETVITVVAILAVILLVTTRLNGQIILPPDTLTVSIPYGENLQGLASEPRSGTDSIRFYVGFDETTFGTIKVYDAARESTPRLRLVRTFRLPFELRHPNDLHINGDTLVVAGATPEGMSHIGFLNKNTGEILQILSDQLPEPMKLNACFSHDGRLYRLISDNSEVLVEQWDGIKNFSRVATLWPSPYRDSGNFIQGTKVIGDGLVVVLTSFPTRFDVFSIGWGFTYLGSFYGRYGGLESEGLSKLVAGDTTFLFYGLRFPNVIARIVLPPSAEIPQAGSVKEAWPGSFRARTIEWEKSLGAITYDVQVASDSDFVTIVATDSMVRASWYTVFSLAFEETYYWRVRARGLKEVGEWSTTWQFSMPERPAETSGSLLSPGLWLFHNYPNPFNSGTWITIGIDSEADVEVAVFDVLGRHVSSIMAERRQPGIYQMLWQPTGLSAGIYVCRAVVGTLSRSIRMAYTK